MFIDKLLFGAAVVATTFFEPAARAVTPADQQEEQAIRAVSSEYRSALEKGDSQAIARFWTSDGEFIDHLGDPHSVAELVAESAKAAKSLSQPQVKVTASKIRFLTSNVAIEDGSSEITLPEGKGTVSKGHYHATWVKQEGVWRIASLCEIPDLERSESLLSELAWMVGIWTADSDGSHLEMTVYWNDTRTFLLRDVTATRDGKSVFRGSQRIGRDPLSDKLKSWNFDSDGGFGEAVWNKDGDSWVEQATGVLADGRESSSTIVIKFDGKDGFTRKSLVGRIGGQPVADQEVQFKREPH